MPDIDINSLLHDYILYVLSLLTIAVFTFFRKLRKKVTQLILRLKIKIFPANFVMALAIESEDELNSGKYYSEIKKILKSELDNSGLGEIVTIKDFADIYLFKSKEEAIAFRNSKDIDLIVWGHFTGDGLKRNGQDINRLNANFTYGFKSAPQKENETDDVIQKNISHIMAKKNHWEITSDNSLDDVRKMAHSLYVITTFIIGLTVGTRGRLEMTEKAFEGLFERLKQQNDPAAEILIPHMIECYSALVKEIIKKQIDYPAGIRLSNKILSLEKKNYLALTTLAMCQYKEGLRNESEETVQKLLAYHPTKSVARMNAAFMNILSGKYEHALKKYKRVFQLPKSHIDFEPQQVMEFLYQEYQATNEPALLFASGAIAHHMTGNDQLAKTDLEMFIKNASANKYGVMYKEAERLINIIKTTS